MRTVFLDTVGLLAVWDTADQWHVDADTVFAELKHQRVRLITTPLVLHECGNAASRKPYRAVVELFRRELLKSKDLIEASAADEDAAWADYSAGVAGSAGIIDHISFAVMRRLGLTEAFTNDKHFQAAGFVTLF